MGKQGSGIHAKGDKNSEVFEDKRPNTSSMNVRVGGSGGPGPDQLALAAEAVPVKPHTSHTTKRSTEILPGGKVSSEISYLLIISSSRLPSYTIPNHPNQSLAPI